MLNLTNPFYTYEINIEINISTLNESLTPCDSKSQWTTVLAALLYGAEVLTVYSVQADRLIAYVMRHLRSKMGISWKNKISNDKVLKRAGLPSLKAILIQMNLR